MRRLLLLMIISTVAAGNVSRLTSWTKRLPQQLLAGVAILVTCGTLACQRDGVRVTRHYLDREIRDLADGGRRVLGLTIRDVDSFRRQTRDATFYDKMAVHLRIDNKSFIGRVARNQENLSTVSVDIFASPDNIQIDLQQISGVLIATFGKKRVTDTTQTIIFVDDMPIIITNDELLLEKGATVSVDSSEAQVISSYLLKFNEPTDKLLVTLNATRLDGLEYLRFSDDHSVVRVMVIINDQEDSYHLQDNETMFVIAHGSAILFKN